MMRSHMCFFMMGRETNGGGRIDGAHFQCGYSQDDIG
jgi:hypothetical protein